MTISKGAICDHNDNRTNGIVSDHIDNEIDCIRKNWYELFIVCFTKQEMDLPVDVRAVHKGMCIWTLVLIFLVMLFLTPLWVEMAAGSPPIYYTVFCICFSVCGVCTLLPPQWSEAVSVNVPGRGIDWCLRAFVLFTASVHFWFVVSDVFASQVGYRHHANTPKVALGIAILFALCSGWKKFQQYVWELPFTGAIGFVVAKLVARAIEEKLVTPGDIASLSLGCLAIFVLLYLLIRAFKKDGVKFFVSVHFPVMTRFTVATVPWFIWIRGDRWDEFRSARMYDSGWIMGTFAVLLLLYAPSQKFWTWAIRRWVAGRHAAMDENSTDNGNSEGEEDEEAKLTS